MADQPTSGQPPWEQILREQPASGANSTSAPGAESAPAPSLLPLEPAVPVPAWRVWEALAVIVLFAGSQFAYAQALNWAAGRLGIPLGADDDPLAGRLRVLLPGVVVLSHATGWLAAYGLVRWWHRQSFGRALALGGACTWRRLRFYAAGLGVYTLSLALVALAPPAADQTNLFTEIFRQGGSTLLVLFVVAVLLAPPLEETLFRGLLLPALRVRLRFFPAAFLVTVLFTALHLTQTGTYWPALAGIFACGWIVAWLRERTQSLWPGILFHMGFNSTPFLVWLIAQPFGGLQ